MKRLLRAAILAFSFVQLCKGYTTLPDNWPIEAEFTPVLLETMVNFKYAAMAYLGGVVNYKPIVQPSVETWVERHSILFRRYSISLEAKVMSYLNTFGGDEFTQGASMIEFISRVESLSLQELAACQSSIITTNQEIQTLNNDIACTKSIMSQSVQALVDAQLLQASGSAPTPTIATIETMIANDVASIVAKEIDIAFKTYCKNDAYEHGINVAWSAIIYHADETILSNAELALDTAIEANFADQKELLVKLENNATAQAYLATEQAKAEYPQEVVDSVCQIWTTDKATLDAALTQKRIDCDEGLLGGTYNPSDYTNVVVSSYVPQQIKYVSFLAFKTAWDSMSLPVASIEDLANWTLNFV